MPNRPVSKLDNIGQTVAKKLAEIGIQTEKDLKKIGAARAYRWLAERDANRHLPVCYYLYSLEGAIQNRHWNDFSETEKAKLRHSAALPK